MAGAEGTWGGKLRQVLKELGHVPARARRSGLTGALLKFIWAQRAVDEVLAQLLQSCGTLSIANADIGVLH